MANLHKLSLHTCVYITGYKIRHGVHSFNFQFRYSKYPTFRRSIIIAPNIKYSAILMERSEGEIIFVPMLFAIFLKNILSIWIYILSMKAKLNEIVTAGGIPRGVFFQCTYNSEIIKWHHRRCFQNIDNHLDITNVALSRFTPLWRLENKHIQGV